MSNGGNGSKFLIIPLHPPSWRKKMLQTTEALTLRNLRSAGHWSHLCNSNYPKALDFGCVSSIACWCNFFFFFFTAKTLLFLLLRCSTKSRLCYWLDVSSKSRDRLLYLISSACKFFFRRCLLFLIVLSAKAPPLPFPRLTLVKPIFALQQPSCLQQDSCLQQSSSLYSPTTLQATSFIQIRLVAGHTLFRSSPSNTSRHLNQRQPSHHALHQHAPPIHRWHVHLSHLCLRQANHHGGWVNFSWRYWYGCTPCRRYRAPLLHNWLRNLCWILLPNWLSCVCKLPCLQFALSLISVALEYLLRPSTSNQACWWSASRCSEARVAPIRWHSRAKICSTARQRTFTSQADWKGTIFSRCWHSWSAR